MRPKRTNLEEAFIKKFMTFFLLEIDKNASVDTEITDKPDLLVQSNDKRVGIEFTQIPSEYIIQNFHTKMPNPTYQKDSIVGDLCIFPFEPHRWVNEALRRKIRAVEVNKQRSVADEMWLVLHAHSEKHEWPMSKGSQQGNRDAELLLMRFGTHKLGHVFDKIFYTYADGSVVALCGSGENVASKISLAQGSGYPAVTTHRFSFSFQVPLPCMGHREYFFNDIKFNEVIVAPKDEWMVTRKPEIKRPQFQIVASVNAKEMTWTVLREGAMPATDRVDTSEFVGKTMYIYTLLEWGIEPTHFSFVI